MEIYCENKEHFFTQKRANFFQKKIKKRLDLIKNAKYRWENSVNEVDF